MLVELKLILIYQPSIWSYKMRLRSKLGSLGERDSIAVVATGADIWHGPTDYIVIPATAGEQMEVVSTDAQDSAAGTGIQQIDVHYLDANGDQQFEEVILNGLTPVQLSESNIRFVQDIHAIAVGNNGVAEGDIWIRKTGTTTTNVYNVIKVGGNMSLTINKMVPANKTLYITHWHASATGSKRITLRLRSTDHHGILLDGDSPVFIFKGTVNLENSAFEENWTEAELFPIPALSIVKISAWASGVGSYVSVAWDGILIDNT